MDARRVFVLAGRVRHTALIAQVGFALLVAGQFVTSLASSGPGGFSHVVGVMVFALAPLALVGIWTARAGRRLADRLDGAAATGVPWRNQAPTAWLLLFAVIAIAVLGCTCWAMLVLGFASLDNNPALRSAMPFILLIGGLFDVLLLGICIRFIVLTRAIKRAMLSGTSPALVPH